MKHCIKNILVQVRYLVILSGLFMSVLFVRADEGMWPVWQLQDGVFKAMKKAGLRLGAGELYGSEQSLARCVVSFGGFCTGVVVSADGLVLTNHHCGFDFVQKASSAEHDFIANGFYAAERDDELPCEGLYVSYLLHTSDVTERVLSGLSPGMADSRRAEVIDSIVMRIEEEACKGAGLRGVVDRYYGDSRFVLSVYRDFDDVRLVYAPPLSIGKFGRERDNWMWPRHTGDFAVFRIYADADNNPAFHDAGNRPYRTPCHAEISERGYEEGDFCMTVGFPGTTERYISSWGVEEIMECRNEPRVKIRSLKLALWRKAMTEDEGIGLKYASKYAQSANYLKNSEGMNLALSSSGIVERKRGEEQQVAAWIAGQDDAVRAEYLQIFNDLRLGYENKRRAERALTTINESFFMGADVLKAAFVLMNMIAGDSLSVAKARSELETLYKDTDMGLDRRLMAAMLENYRDDAGDSGPMMPFYDDIDSRFAGDTDRYVEWLYANSVLSDAAKAVALPDDETFSIFDDPMGAVALDVLAAYMDVSVSIADRRRAVADAERRYLAVRRKMYEDRLFYPDADSSMRVSFGTVRGYRPYDGAWYECFTTVPGILEKYRKNTGDGSYALQKPLADLFAAGDYGGYAGADGEMRVCFLTDNDITGGNSGSPMFNARGQLIGLAFDSNWEGLAGNVCYEPDKQRCIGVDIRYILYIIDRFSHAGVLLEELCGGK